MKKLIFFGAVIILFSSSVYPTPTGIGTLLSPYSGTITENTTWYPDTYPGQTIYANGITIGWGITLIISPGASSGGHVNFLGTSVLTIGENGTFIINPGTSVTVHRLVNNGTLILESNENEAGVASLINRLYSGSGSEVNRLRLYLSGGEASPDAFKWHYVSSPVAGTNVSTFATLNLARYVEPLVVSSDNFPGWVAWDGYQYSGGTQPSYAFSTLTLGHGYNYFSEESVVLTLEGGINYSDVEVNVTCGTGFPDIQGYNLLGNPFTSCLDWDKILADYTPAYVNNAIYFTLNGAIASYVDGIGADGGTGTIPPMQGFFVKAVANSSIYLPAAARTHNLDQMRYKKKSTAENYNSTDTISFIRLVLGNSKDSTDLVVRFNNGATSDVDKRYDAYEFSRTAGNINVWTTTGDVDFSINGLPFPATSVEIPVGINVKTAGDYKLSCNEINKLDNYSVTLKDLTSNASVNLGQGGFLKFYSQVGLIENRFVIVVTKSATAISKVSQDVKKFKVFASLGAIYIRLLTDDFYNLKGYVTIYDHTGRKVLQNHKVEWQQTGDLKQIDLRPSSNGLFIVEIKAGNTTYVEKVVLL